MVTPKYQRMKAVADAITDSAEYVELRQQIEALSARAWEMKGAACAPLGPYRSQMDRLITDFVGLGHVQCAYRVTDLTDDPFDAMSEWLYCVIVSGDTGYLWRKEDDDGRFRPELLFQGEPAEVFAEATRVFSSLQYEVLPAQFIDGRITITDWGTHA